MFVFTKRQKELIHIQEMQMSGPKPSDFAGGGGEGPTALRFWLGGIGVRNLDIGEYGK